MSVGELLGGDKVLGVPIDSNLDLAKATRAGLPSTTAILLAREILEIPSAVEGSSSVGITSTALGGRYLGKLWVLKPWAYWVAWCSRW